MTERSEQAGPAPAQSAWTRIATPRLVLVALPVAALRAAAEGRLDEAGRIAGCDLRPFPAEEREIAEIRCRDLEQDPGYFPWSLRAICLKPDLRFVGHFNFHTKPDPDYLRDLAPGAVELGYYILPEFRRRGLAEEAARGMMDWAARSFGVRRFVVSVGPDNAASVAVAAKLGFSRIGSHIDDEDGYEDILALTRSG
ncbi:MAG TPA: GNAT family N-acetyltransferase [Alphaproteobacteria bacterium]|nr:GNAT family N-acetyltransferase [Alphaproteobacteria bacterium]